jgi:sigma-B regulation protein RsbU (phosphoserine phosphatase)
MGRIAKLDVPSPAAPAAPQPAPAPRKAGRPEISFRTKLLLTMGALVLFTGAAITLLAVRGMRSTAMGLASSLFREVSQHSVTRARGFLARAVPVVSSLKELAGDGLAIDDTDHLARQLTAVLRANPDLTWVSFGDESGTFTGAYRTSEGVVRVNQSSVDSSGKTLVREHNVLPNGAWQLHREDKDSGYDPRQRPFYLKAKEAGHLVWLPPYIFYDQGVPGITCADPVYDATGKLRGVFTVDFDLNALSDFVSTVVVSPHSRTFICTSDGLLLAHPDKRLVTHSRARGQGTLPKLTDTGDPLAAAFAEHLKDVQISPVQNNRFAEMRLRDRGGEDYLASGAAFRMDRDLVWVVGVVAPESDFLAPVWRSERTAVAISLGALFIAGVLAVAMSRRVSQPVTSLIGFMRGVGDGNLDARADIRGSREFRELSDELNHMLGLLRDRLALRHSLGVAMDVQQRLLPSKPPNIPGLDIAGHSTYCDETGGDYYDYLAIEEAGPRRLLIALGDVMGHGVAAALIMAGARAILRSRVRGEGSLAGLVKHLNDLLVHDLDGKRFMTMHLSIIDLEKGVFRWASAGHDPALIYNPSDDHFEEIDAAGLPLGVNDDSDYVEAQYEPLMAGHVILIGTDGIWETRNPEGEEFGKERLRAVIRETADRSAADIIDAIVSRLDAFRGRKNPEDDVTLVVVKVKSLVVEPERHIPVA